jgi:hypothetical protein
VPSVGGIPLERYTAFPRVPARSIGRRRPAVSRPAALAALVRGSP